MEERKYEWVFFCQAYNDVGYILAEVNKLIGVKILIIVVNNRGILQFFRELGLINDLVYFETKTKRGKYIDIAKEFLYLKHVNNKYLRNIYDTNIVFYASFYDLLTCFCIRKLVRNNQVFLGIPLEDEFKPIKQTFKGFLYSLIYRSPIGSYMYGEELVFGLSLGFIKNKIRMRPNITNEILHEAIKRYSITVDSSFKSFILLLDSNDESLKKRIDEFESKLENIYNVFRKRNTVVKCHPRLGESNVCGKFDFKRLNPMIPVEFYAMNKNDFVVGINSISLANMANNGFKVISIVEIVTNDYNIISEVKNYLNKYSDAEIYYPKNINELKIIIDETNRI
jgi:hypothetical protein